MRAIILVILTSIRAWTPSPRRESCTALRAHPAFKQKKDPKYSLEAAVEAGEAAQRAGVPQSFDDVLDEMGASVAAALESGGERFLVECLPPGLNPELEMTCPYDPSRELAVVQALLNAIPRRAVSMLSRNCVCSMAWRLTKVSAIILGMTQLTGFHTGAASSASPARAPATRRWRRARWMSRGVRSVVCPQRRARARTRPAS